MYIYSTERLGSTYAAMSFWMSFCNKKKNHSKEAVSNMEWQSNVSRKLQEVGGKGFDYFLSKWPKKSMTMRGLANVQTDEIQSGHF